MTRTPETQAKTLIEKIDAEAGEEIAAILEEARREADQIVTEARKGARRKVREAVSELRDMRDSALFRAAAGIETKRRELRQSRALAALTDGMDRIEADLLELWNDPRSRWIWCRNVVDVAATHLISKDWCLEHPPEVPQEFLHRLGDLIEEKTGARPALEPAPDIDAGIRIRAGSAWAEASAHGLLGDRQALSALYLRILDSLDRDGPA